MKQFQLSNLVKGLNLKFFKQSKFSNLHFLLYRAKTIKNSVSVNKQRSIAELNSIIEKLNKELISLNAYIESLEELIRETKGQNFDFISFKKNVIFPFIFE